MRLAFLGALPSSSPGLLPTRFLPILSLILRAASAMASESTSAGSPGASASSPSSISSMAARCACTLALSCSLYLLVDFAHTKVNLLAFASTLVPSRK